MHSTTRARYDAVGTVWRTVVAQPMPEIMTRARVLADLRRMAAGSTHGPAARDLPGTVWLAARRHFGSLEGARRAAGLKAPEVPRRWSRDAVIAEIRRLHKAGVRITDIGLKDRRGLVSALRSYVGSIAEARRVAGVPEPSRITRQRVRWDEATVVSEINLLHEAGKSIAASKVPTRLARAAKRYFGSWSQAVDAAGFDAREVRLVRAAYTRGELLAILRSLAEARPRMRLVEFYDHGFIPALVRLFGNVDDALASAGLTNWPTRERTSAMPRSEVLEAIRLRAREGRGTNWQVVRADAYHLWYSGVVHFGDWRRAVAGAGVELSGHNRQWNKARLVHALRSRSKRHESLRPSDLRRDDGGLYASVIWHFGSYAAGLKAAKLNPPAR